jgi:hypothetical protein
MTLFTGMKYFLDQVGVQTTQVQAAFSFYQSQIVNTNSVYSDEWATSSSSGILNKEATGQFFNYSGTGYFNGSAYMQLSNPYTFDNDTILLSYEKLKTGDEILMSSATGNNITNYSGFCAGINNANKFYFKYWNPVEGVFTFTYSKELANKNLMILNRNSNILTIGNLNNNTLGFETESFYIKNNIFQQSNQLFIGGTPNKIPWAHDNSSNFSGYVDKFFILKDAPFIYNKQYLSGIISVNSGVLGSYQTNCYTTGYLTGSGFSTSGVTGYLTTIFNITTTGITGYKTGINSYLYTGVTGYDNISLGYYSDNCNNLLEIFNQVPLSGLITLNSQYNIPITGLIINTGYNQSPLTGKITGTTQVYVTGQTCNSVFIETGSSISITDNNYLASLSFSRISLISEINKSFDILESYNEDYQPKFLDYNNNLIFDSTDDTFFNNKFIDDNSLPSGLLLFLNGQLIVDSGFSLKTVDYNTYVIPSIDYYRSGTQIYVDELTSKTDDIFYDYFTGNSELIYLTGISSGSPLVNSNFNNKFIFINGHKLVSGITYSGTNTINMNIPSGNNFVLLKQISKLNYFSGNSCTLKLGNFNLNKNCSQVYLNGIKQKLFDNYIENSNFSLLSGEFYENKNNYIIYNNTDDFFV